MKKIELTQNQFVIVDDEDFNRLSQHKWHTKKCKHTCYAVRTIIIQSQNKKKNIKRKNKRIYMHREILENKEGRTLHHMNRKKNKGTLSIYKGVSWHKRNRKWIAQIRLYGKLTHLGYFNCEIAAAKAYDKIALRYFSDFIRLNFVIDKVTS